MELLFVTILGAGIGALVRYMIPGRQSYGMLLIPAIAAAVAAAKWVALVWLGWTFDGTWIWVVSLGAAAVVSLVLALWLPRRRSTTDARLLTQLSAHSAVRR
jgi:hypothetical protein